MKKTKEQWERAQRVIDGFYEEWGILKPIAGPIEGMSVEHLDNVSPLLKAMEYFNKLLLQDMEEGHLSSETNEAINKAMADLAHAIVKFACTPQLMVKMDD